MQLDSNDRKLLNLIQAEFPLTAEPYADLGRRLGVSAVEVMQHIARLKENRIIRLIGPVIDARSLGFHSTLVGMKVAGAGLEKAEQVIATHPGVSHGYERDHEFNVWLTLALPPESDIEAEVEKLARSAGAEVAFSLASVKMFKLGAYFDMDGDGQTAPKWHRKSALAGRVELSATERLIINELQQDLALVPDPFSAPAQRAGVDVEQLLAACRSLQERGVIRRFSASINHRNTGLTANAMTCWAAPGETVNSAGWKLAELKEVSHCYERKTNHHWRYNLFAMIHGRSREICQGVAEKVSRETGLTDYATLYSTEEFKKTRVKYVV